MTYLNLTSDAAETIASVGLEAINTTLSNMQVNNETLGIQNLYSFDSMENSAEGYANDAEDYTESTTSSYEHAAEGVAGAALLIYIGVPILLICCIVCCIRACCCQNKTVVVQGAQPSPPAAVYQQLPPQYQAPQQNQV